MKKLKEMAEQNGRGELEKLKAQVNGEKIDPANHYLLETLQPGIINRLLYAFGYRMDFTIVPMSICDVENSSNWNLPINAIPKPFFDRIFYISEGGANEIKTFHSHMALKQTLKEIVSFIPMMHYFDYKTGRFMAKADALRKVKKKQFKDREAKFGGDEVPEDEDMEE